MPNCCQNLHAATTLRSMLDLFRKHEDRIQCERFQMTKKILGTCNKYMNKRSWAYLQQSADWCQQSSRQSQWPTQVAEHSQARISWNWFRRKNAINTSAKYLWPDKIQCILINPSIFGGTLRMQNTHENSGTYARESGNQRWSGM